MENNQTQITETQGVEEITQTQVKEWLKNDLSKCIMMLNAIHSDPDMLDTVANFMYGRLQNAKKHN